ncbi:MAG TPA: TolC family protein [Planctomycetota bacterium]|nr:TolC family protein [Planctomycetota bacterium]
MRRKQTLLLAAALLAACASHHDDLAGWAPQDPAPEAPPDMADGDVVGEAGAGPLRTELTIEEAVTEALAHNRAVQQARLNVAIGIDNAQEARSALLPQVNILGTYDAVDKPRQIVTGGSAITTAPYSTWGFAASMDFPIFAFGRHLNTWRAARLAQQSAESQQQAVEADTAAAVTAAAFDVLETIRRIDVAKSNEDALAQQVKDAQAQLDAGSATKVAVLEASVEYDAAKRVRERLESLVPVSKMTLNRLLGRPANSPIEVADEPTTRAPIWQLEPLVQEAIDRRPELRAARLDVATAERTLQATIGGELGEIRGTLVWDTDDNPFRAPSDQVNLGITYELPVFTAGARPARIRRARHQLESSTIVVRDLEAAVRQEVAEAYRNAVESYRDIAVAGSAVERQEESVRIQREKFQNGRATSREVLDSVALLRNARFELVNSTYSYNIALRELVRARGADPREDPFAEVVKSVPRATGAPATLESEIEDAIRKAAPGNEGAPGAEGEPGDVPK